MLIYENKKHGLNFSSVSETKINEIIPIDEAIGIYCVGNGFGNTEGFENCYKPGMTYKMFIDILVKQGLLVQRR